MFVYCFYDGSELFIIYDVYFGIGLYLKEVRRVCFVIYIVVFSIVVFIDNDGEFWDISVGNGCDEFGVVFCDVFMFGSGVDYEVGNVLEED